MRCGEVVSHLAHNQEVASVEASHRNQNSASNEPERIAPVGDKVHDNGKW